MFDRINIEEMKKDLKEQGFHQVLNFFTEEEMEAIKLEIPLNNAANYNEDNLKSNAVYPSLVSESRQSFASMMIEEGQTNDLPNVKIQGTVIKDVMRFHDKVLSGVLGQEVPTNNRKMVNWQMYSQDVVGDSKFLRRHRDGNYCSFTLTDNKTFKVEEGLFNQYIFGFNVMNDNDGVIQGTSFYDLSTGKTIHPKHPKGSFVIFDNIRLEHFVEELSSPRIFLGIRSYDIDPYHFVSPETIQKHDMEDMTIYGYTKMESLDSPGYSKKVTTEEAKVRLLKFYKNEWPAEYARITKDGVVF